MARESPTSTRRMEAAKRKAEILRLKQLRYTNTEIADILGITRQHVHEVLKTQKAEWEAEAAEYVEKLVDEREAAHGRMLYVVRKLLERIEVEEKDPETGEVVAMHLDYKAIERHADYERLMADIYGYGAPKRNDVTSNGETLNGPLGAYTVPVMATMAEWTKQSIESAAADAAAADELLAEGSSDEAAPDA